VLKTGELLVDKILDQISALPNKPADKVAALVRLGQLAGVYINETGGVLDRVFGSSLENVLHHNDDDNPNVSGA